MNESAFRELYEEHKSLVMSLALAYVQNLEDAEEITQDVFLKIHRRLNSFEHRSNIRTWIYRITVNRCLDVLRSQSADKRKTIFSRLVQYGKDEMLIPSGDFNHPGIRLENLEATENLMQLMNRLPFNQKTALLLKSLEDQSQKEIAAIMNLSEKAVESLLSRAKNNLREMMNKSKE